MASIRKLVMVDDDEDLAALLKLKLEKTGRYDVTTTTEGSKIIDLVREVSPDLILLDIDMPDMSGGDVAKLLSEPKDTKDIPILFLSSLVGRSEATAGGGTIGGHQMASKSGSLRELMEKIQSVLATE
jgi:DNA-binding response OmpR family regulator